MVGFWAFWAYSVITDSWAKQNIWKSILERRYSKKKMDRLKAYVLVHPDKNAEISILDVARLEREVEKKKDIVHGNLKGICNKRL
jgi:hypothetical protein